MEKKEEKKKEEIQPISPLEAFTRLMDILSRITEEYMNVLKVFDAISEILPQDTCGMNSFFESRGILVSCVTLNQIAEQHCRNLIKAIEENIKKEVKKQNISDAN